MAYDCTPSADATPLQHLYYTLVTVPTDVAALTASAAAVTDFDAQVEVFEKLHEQYPQPVKAWSALVAAWPGVLERAPMLDVWCTYAYLGGDLTMLRSLFEAALAGWPPAIALDYFARRLPVNSASSPEHEEMRVEYLERAEEAVDAAAANAPAATPAPASKSHAAGKDKRK